MSNFTKLELLSKHIFGYISGKVEKATGYPLELIGEFRYSYIKESDRQVMRVDSKHNGNDISFLVHFDEGTLLEVDKYKTKYLKELNKVANFIISYIKNCYKE